MGHINIFEGGRRLAKLAWGIWAIAVIAWAWLAKGTFPLDTWEKWWNFLAAVIPAVWVPIVVGALVMLAVCQAIGWVVRGFLGVPKGMDFRPEPVAPDLDI